MAETGELVRRMYGNFRGVDFRSDECDVNRSPDSVNMWRNYMSKECVETRPGMKRIFSRNDEITYVKFIRDYIFIGSGKTVHWKKITDKSYTQGVITSLIGDVKMQPFQFGEKIYVIGSNGDMQITETGDWAAPTYIPITSQKRRPMPDGTTIYSGGGEVYEDVNLLINRRKNSFIGDGVNKCFFLDCEDFNYPFASVDGVSVKCKRNSITTNGRTVYYVELEEAPPFSEKDNVVITVDVGEMPTDIRNCTIYCNFDNRVFYSGNPDYPNRVWYSALENPLYVKSLDYYNDGTDTAKIVDMVAGHNGLWVFREPSATNESVFYHTPAIDDVEGKIYPSTHSNISLGCVGKAINFNDDIVFFSQRGMEGISADVTTEQFATHRSSLVDKKLLASEYYKDMHLVEWKGYLCVFVGNEVFLADSRAILQNESHMEYEWYYWNLGNRYVSCATEHEGILYIGTYSTFENGTTSIDNPMVYKSLIEFTNDASLGDDGHDAEMPIPGITDGSKINSYWTTPKDKFNASNKAKTTNKKGFVVEATGNMKLHAKTDEEDDFGFVSEHIEGTNYTDHFVARLKKKKFKDLQLKFSSDTKFSLESATLEAIVGGYVKGR